MGTVGVHSGCASPDTFYSWSPHKPNMSHNLYSAPARAVFALYTSLRSVTKADCPTGLSKSKNIRMIFTDNENLSITWKNHHHHVS